MDLGICCVLRQVYPRRSCLSVRWFAALEPQSENYGHGISCFWQLDFFQSDISRLRCCQANPGLLFKYPVQISAVGVNKSTATYSQLLPQTFSQLVAVQISVHMSLVWSGSMITHILLTVLFRECGDVKRHILHLVCTWCISHLSSLEFLVVKLEVQFGEGEVWSQVMQNPIWR